MKYTEYMKERVTNYWKNAKIDYDVDGEFIDSYIRYERLYIQWREFEITYTMYIDRYNEYTPEDCFNIWMESDWSFWAD